MGNPFVGEIRIFAGTFAPAGWASCDGQLLPIAENTTLFALIGTTYGGDGQQTFALPDLRGRLPLHAGSGHTLGEAGGTERVALTVNQLPAHGHIPQASAHATASTPAGNYWAGTPDFSAFAAGAMADGNMNPAAMTATGGNQAHENLPPFLTATFIISLFGIFPSQA